MEHETGHGRTGRRLLAFGLAALLALAAAVPVFAEEPTDDGETVQPQVVGGTAVPDNKYRFMAAVRDVTRGDTAYQQQFCGGTLIDRDSVLTAAHCMEGVVAPQLRVTVGITDLTRNQGQTRGVESIFRHPRYITSNVSYRYDAAVLELGRPVRGISPVKIPGTASNSLETPGRQATVAGWGNTVLQSPGGGEPDRFPARMREARVPVVSDAAGRSVYGGSYAPALMLAAGREGRDTCQGDSGGPIFVRASSATYQIGITSFGNGCGAAGFPGVYAEANASSIRGFIFDAARR